jgi:hypothetical protein
MDAGAPVGYAGAQEPEPTTLDPLAYSMQRVKQSLPQVFSQLYPNREMGQFNNEKEYASFMKYAQGLQSAFAERKYKQLERYEKMLKDFTGASVSQYMKTGDPATLERLKKGTESNLQKIALEGVKEFNKMLTKPTKPDGSEYTAWEYGVEFASKLQRGLETTEVQRQPGDATAAIPEATEAIEAQAPRVGKEGRKPADTNRQMEKARRYYRSLRDRDISPAEARKRTLEKYGK